MINQDIYATIGAAIELSATSKYHQQFPLMSCLSLQILPAIENKQIKIYYSKDEQPEALVIWAWFSDTILKSMCSPRGRVIERGEWNCGSNLFFSDFIAPYGNTRDIFKKVFNHLFPDIEKATSIRRNIDGSLRKKNIWHRSKFAK